MESSPYEVVVGIDFGSSGMGYAYSFNDIKNIILGKLPSASADSKVSTEIILNDKNETLDYGKRCEEFLSIKGINAGHYFKNIKMNLYFNKKEIQAENSEKKISLKGVI